VLIVVSSYRPAMLADMQRARALAWELPALGWDVEILTPAASEVRPDAIEPDAAGFFADDTAVHEVRAWLSPLFRMFTSRTGSWRMALPMFWRGRRLLASGRFDLVYFTTTAFILVSCGSRWRRRFGVPYVIDFQDPWLLPPQHYRGRGWKGRLMSWLDPYLEKRGVGHAAGLIAVSDAYIAALTKRYHKLAPSWLDARRHAVIPFAADERDLLEAGRRHCRAAAVRADELLLHYVGAGPTMQRSFCLICEALARLRACGDAVAGRVRIRLFGTGRPGPHAARPVLKPVADAAGVGDLVDEQPERVPYRRALELVCESGGVLVLGVDDAGYVPSKLFGYALSGKPLLASLRCDGAAYALFRAEPRLGHAVWLDETQAMPLDKAAGVLGEFLREVASGATFDRRPWLQSRLAPAMAQRHAALFEACLQCGAPV
jgi:hypothetical protein